MPQSPLHRSVWDEPAMHRALAGRDISTVYRLLNEMGVSQRRISLLTGQSQSEVSEIVKGRQVVAYRVLERIAAGLGVPRGHMGLAYAEGRVAPYAGDDDDPFGWEVDDEMISRRFLGAASAALLGAAVVGEAGGLRLLTGPPSTLGTNDPAWIRTMTERIWDMDLEHGGSAAWAAARGAAMRVVGALRSGNPNSDLKLAASGLCRAAGWSAFDAGRTRDFWQLHATALDLAHQAGATDSVVTIVSDAGRAEILSGNHRAAARLFELTATKRSPDAVGWGLLGSAYAPNSADSARGALQRLRDSEGSDTVDATSMFGHVSLDLGDHATAVESYSKVLPSRSGRLAVQETAPMAEAHLQAGETAAGLHHAERALRLSETVRSTKASAALRRLGTVLAAQKDSTAQDLARRIQAV